MIHNFENTLKRLIEFGLLTDDEENECKEFLLFVEKSITPRTDYMRFIHEFNQITGKKYNGDTESRELFYKAIINNSLDDLIKALQNSLLDKWILENITILTPKYILKDENTGKYINYTGRGSDKGDNRKGQTERADQPSNFNDIGL